MTEGPGGFFLPFPFQPDPEMLQKMREAHEHQEMVVEDYHHGVARLLDGLNEEQMLALKSLMHVIVANSEDSSRVIPAFYEGIITGILSSRYGICTGCNNNHDKLMKEQMERESQQQETLPAMDGGDPFRPAANFVGVVDQPIGGTGILSATQLENMEEYNLDDLRDEETNKLIAFVCTKCGLQYPTIEDRMLKGPDDCHGCHMKAAHG